MGILNSCEFPFILCISRLWLGTGHFFQICYNSCTFLLLSSWKFIDLLLDKVEIWLGRTGFHSLGGHLINVEFICNFMRNAITQLQIKVA